MMLIRPIQSSDLDDLLYLAEHAGVGVTTLPANRDLLAEKIHRSEKSFAEQVPKEQRFYFFTLVDTDSGRCVGVSGLEAGVGHDDVWYNYRISNSVNASRELGVHVETPTLYLTNDMTGCSELCSLFLDANYRRDGNGPKISRCRFLFLADFGEDFSQKVFAEMRGFSDANGRSPFWEALGRKFFNIDFSRADYLTGLGNKSFIAEMMPKYPIYLPFLPKEARDVVGQVHENTRPALRMLQHEGFHFNGLIDIFDAGPVVEAFTDNIRAVRESYRRHVLVAKNPAIPTDPKDQVLVSNRSFDNFRVASVPASNIKQDTISLPVEVAENLDVVSGDTVRVVNLKDRRFAHD